MNTCGEMTFMKDANGAYGLPGSDWRGGPARPFPAPPIALWPGPPVQLRTCV